MLCRAYETFRQVTAQQIIGNLAGQADDRRVCQIDDRSGQNDA
jgi:hypothetical protein